LNAQLQINLGQDFFLSRVRAPAKKNRARGVDPEDGENFARYFRPHFDLFGIEFDAADVPDACARNAKSLPSRDVFEFLNADKVKESENGSDEYFEPGKTTLRSQGKSRIHEREWNRTRVRDCGKVWPNFSFHENDSGGPDQRKCAPRDRPEIERIVHHSHPSACLFRCEREAGRSGGCESDSQIRLAFFELGRELQRDHYFAHADGMNPGPAMRAQALADIAVIKAEPLSEFMAVISASQHFPDVARQKEQERDRKKEIVEKTNHATDRSTASAGNDALCKNKTSVAP
jgi:hypothetical protein